MSSRSYRLLADENVYQLQPHKGSSERERLDGMERREDKLQSHKGSSERTGSGLKKSATRRFNPTRVLLKVRLRRELPAQLHASTPQGFF